MKPKLPISLLTILISGGIYSQSINAKNDSTYLSLNKTDLTSPHSTRIKWTKQLPEAVRESFFKSCYADWFIEKMIRYDSNGKTAYRIFVDNGNLLDGDHHDGFLKKDSLDITDKGAVLKR